MKYFVLIKRRPRGVFNWSSLFVGADLEEAKKTAAETIFGELPNTPDELFERYNVDIVEMTDEWENKLNAFSLELAGCPAPS